MKKNRLLICLLCIVLVIAGAGEVSATSLGTNGNGFDVDGSVSICP